MSLPRHHEAQVNDHSHNEPRQVYNVLYISIYNKCGPSEAHVTST